MATHWWMRVSNTVGVTVMDAIKMADEVARRQETGKVYVLLVPGRKDGVLGAHPEVWRTWTKEDSAYAKELLKFSRSDRHGFVGWREDRLPPLGKIIYRAEIGNGSGRNDMALTESRGLL